MLYVHLHKNKVKLRHLQSDILDSAITAITKTLAERISFIIRHSCRFPEACQSTLKLFRWLVVTQHLPRVWEKYIIKLFSLVFHQKHCQATWKPLVLSIALNFPIGLTKDTPAYTHTSGMHTSTLSCPPGDIRLIENEKVRKRDGQIGRDWERKRRQMEKERSVGEETLTDWESYLMRQRSLYCIKWNKGRKEERKEERGKGRRR